MTPAETLTAAADRLAAILDDDIAPGPWEYGASSNPEHYGSCWVADPEGVVILHGGDECWTETEYAAAMNPVVGRALVGVLRHLAAAIVTMLDAAGEGASFDVPVIYWHELDLARAILGEVAA